MNQEFNIGDVVLLKSGGPKMTVSSKIYNGEHTARWFDKNDVKFSTFKPELLEKYEEKTPAHLNMPASAFGG